MYGEDQALSSLFDNLNEISAQTITGERTGGGTGGGADLFEQDPMETNRFVSMNLNPYLTQNVHSFKGGGRMHSPYRYQEGGNYQNIPYGSPEYGALNQAEYMKWAIANNRGITRPGGRMAVPLKYGAFSGNADPLSTKEKMVNFGPEYRDFKVANRPELIPKFQEGGVSDMGGSPGMYEQQANEMIAVNQLANLLGGMGANQQQPIANRGMKMPKRYTQGGRF